MDVSSKIVIDGLSYDPGTGVFTWIVPKDRAGRRGDKAGSLNSDGYRQIRWNGKKPFAHRLAWLFVYGEFPSEKIDHRNGDRDDNRICNLRLATVSQNNANRRVVRDGLKGAYFCKRSGKWKSSIRENGEKKHLGYFETEIAAHDAYAHAAFLIHGEYARVG